MHIFGETLSTANFFFLLLALGLALSFEFVNGFHDTANAVATVIYTHSLKPYIAVVWSGMWNLIGVLVSTGTVAFGILALLPVELVLNVGSAAGFAMVFALLISAIIWNVGTWYLGLPASSSHTLIGAIMGVGLANSMMSAGHVFGEGVNWNKAREVGLSLLVSPVVGFVCSALLLLVMKALIKREDLYRAPDPDKPPPAWIRGLLVLTCTGVSYAHGSNDGQKGMGLIMLILIGIVPASFAVNLNTNAKALQEMQQATQTISFQMDQHAPGVAMAAGQTAANELSSYLKTTGKLTDRTWAAIGTKCREISTELTGRNDLNSMNKDQRMQLRSDLYLVSESLGKINKGHKLDNPEEQKSSGQLKSSMDKVTKFIPVWVKFAVAIALGLGTMIGWKRIVVTVGEKIGKEHLTYAQGASAELVAMATILAADNYGLPVSTTHVLSSGIAGTMAANHSGLQMDTLRNLLLAWVLTLPVCVLLGAGLFSFGLYFLLHVLGLHG
ncbi:inorganic phosphate transporter [Nevskia soli]|uniref:inorganic phosphate transporter n=1 Tax=Nevskia soli TaxID=418856 RepID=UPI001C5C89B2|nr:inorganic phosphate transporter [Nevskia soli]